jgi:mannose-1-phosphate guanylyltransferase
VEKPDFATAEKYIASGDYLWNAGMFIMKASVMLEELGRTKPDLLAGILELAEVWDDKEKRGPVVDRVWPKLEKIAIDYSIAEPAADAGRLVTIPAEFDWDDVGDFASIAKLHSTGHKNDLAILGEGARVLSDASSGIVVTETGRTIALIGVRDIVVVDTGDALLVTTTANAQKVKAVVDALRIAGRDDVL